MSARGELGGDGKEAPTARANCAFKRFDSEGNEKNRVVARGGSKIEAIFLNCELEYFCRQKEKK